MLKNKVIYIFYITLISYIASCTNSQNSYKYGEKKIPANNLPYLNGSLANNANPVNNNIAPHTQTQYGHINNKPVANQSFYNSLFTPQRNSQEVIIQDEVANNQIKTIKEEVIINQAETKPQVKEITLANKAGFYVQIGAYSKLKNAENIKKDISEYGNVVLTPNQKGNLIKVRIGPLQNITQAKSLQSTLKENGFAKTIIIEEKNAK